MVYPGDEPGPAAGGRVGMRASHADREQVVAVLKAAFVQGRLAKEELDLRVAEALATRTYGGLYALTADIPAGLVMTQPLAPARQPGSQPGWRLTEKSAVRMIAALLVAVPSVAFAVGLTGPGIHPELGVATRLLYIVLFACVVALPAAGLVMFHSWLASRSGGPATAGAPRPDGETAQRQAPAGPAPTGRAQTGQAVAPAQTGHEPRHGTLWAAAQILAGPRFPPAS